MDLWARVAVLLAILVALPIVLSLAERFGWSPDRGLHRIGVVVGWMGALSASGLVLYAAFLRWWKNIPLFSGSLDEGIIYTLLIAAVLIWIFSRSIRSVLRDEGSTTFELGSSQWPPLSDQSGGKRRNKLSFRVSPSLRNKRPD